jgi:WASH complex subunit CCDC53
MVPSLLYNSAEFANMQPMPIRKTLMVVNHFVVNTTNFINKFALLCEQKLQRVSQDVQRLEIVLKLLEGRLSSIDWLGTPLDGASSSSTLDSVPTFDSSTASSGASPSTTTPSVGTQSSIETAASTAAAADAALAEPQAEPAAVDVLPVSQDPLYSKYFKMLKLGVVKPQIAMKMQSDGLDPSIIEYVSYGLEDACARMHVYIYI